MIHLAKPKTFVFRTLFNIFRDRQTWPLISLVVDCNKFKIPKIIKSLKIGFGMSFYIIELS